MIWREMKRKKSKDRVTSRGKKALHRGEGDSFPIRKSHGFTDAG